MAIIVSGVVLMPCIMILPSILCYLTVKKKTNVVIYSALFALLWGLAGYYFMNPMTDPDLVRYLQILEQYSDKSLLESFNLVYSNLYAVDIYFYIISKLGNPQMLPAISVFIYYFILLYILADYKIRVRLTNKIFIRYVIFALCSINFCSIVNGIRWPLAFAIFFFAFYRECIQEKKNFATVLLYVIAVFLHFSTLVYVILRFVLFAKNRKVILVIGASVSTIPYLMNILSNALANFTTSLPVVSQIVYFIKRGNMYFQWGEGEWADIVRKSTYYKLESWYYYLIVALFGVILLVMFRYRRYVNNLKLRLKWDNKEIFVFYMFVITILSFTMSAHTYIRFVIPLIMCFSIVFFRFEMDAMNKTVSAISYLGMSLCSVVGIVLNLYLLRTMVDLREYFSNIVSSGMMKVILENVIR